MDQWDENVKEDHRQLCSQAAALEAALTIDVGEEDRRVVLSWIVRNLWPSLELHLRKEEEVLFPVLERLLRKDASALTLLKQQHQQLRSSLRHLAELVQDPGHLEWESIELAKDAFIDLLEDHEAKEERLLLDVLEFSLKPMELKILTQALKEVAQKAHEEGWPRAWWERPKSASPVNRGSRQSEVSVSQERKKGEV